MRASCLVLVVAIASCGTGVDAPDGASSDAASVRDTPAIDAPIDAATLDATDATTGCRYGGGCDLIGQDCGAGRACVPGIGASLCISAGTTREGEACASATDCRAGTLCGGGVCLRVACAPSDCAPGTLYIATLNDGLAPLPSGAGFCAVDLPCRPVPNDCGTGEQCQIVLDGTSCRSTGASIEGAECNPEPCALGLGCVDGSEGSPGMCGRYCRLGSDADCPTGTCTAYALWGTYGVCR